MNNYSTVDRQSFQELLASAFAVQQLDSKSRSLFVEVGRLVTKGDLDVDGAVHLIGDRTRNPANTTGGANGLLSADIARELALKDIAEQADLATKVGAAAKQSTPPPRDEPSTADHYGSRPQRDDLSSAGRILTSQIQPHHDTLYASKT